MKQKFSLLLLFVCISAYAQTSATLQSDVKTLYVASDEIDIDTLSKYLCANDPANIYEILDGYFQSDERKFRFVFTNAKFNYSDIRIINGETYCGITFRNVVRITYFSPVDVAQKQQTLKEQFNAQSIVYDAARNAFLIVYNAKMIARADLGSGHWKFAFIDNTFPQEISAGCFSDQLKKDVGL